MYRQINVYIYIYIYIYIYGDSAVVPSFVHLQQTICGLMHQGLNRHHRRSYCHILSLPWCSPLCSIFQYMAGRQTETAIKPRYLDHLPRILPAANLHSTHRIPIHLHPRIGKSTRHENSGKYGSDTSNMRRIFCNLV